MKLCSQYHADIDRELYEQKYLNKNVTDIIEWLVHNTKNCRIAAKMFSTMCTGNIKLIDILIQYKVPYDRDTLYAMENTGRLKYTNYLLDKGY